ncbi:hypothetical protein PR048_000844 [Dryococelus australis]|uniref:DDE Tnp4 domain-containing protein n=1 Tax=Dryococelus australis TaxID=614101 RepID=A0ABQ9IH52_9NEOP|nr:hypothetical protein PR048_000844 [Dryococelus australis]
MQTNGNRLKGSSTPAGTLSALLWIDWWQNVSLQIPSLTGTEFFNYKGYFSIVFIAVVDADIATRFCKQLTGSCLNLPHSSPLTGRTLPIPPVFVADGTFPLSNNIRKHFPG